jgi:L-asparaginase
MALPSPDAPVTRPRLLLVATGGRAAPPEAAAALGGAAEVATLAVPARAGAGFAPADIVRLAQAIADALADGCDGAAVILDADTIEETAFVLDLLVGGPKPVVAVAAAEGQPGLPPGCLAAALQLAAAAEARGLGTLVLAGARIHAARFVREARAGAAFRLRSAPGGPLGGIVAGRPCFWSRVARLPVLPAQGGPPRPVALLRWALGDDGRRLHALVLLGYAGAVVEGLGAGHVPEEAVPGLARLATRMPVVLAGRVPGDPVGQAGAPGGLLRKGLIAAGCLSGLKARLLLGLALRGAAGHGAAAAAFAPYQ